MKIVVLGGGITGLTAAHYLVTQGHDVTVIEKGKSLGGLAQGFKEPEWEWSLDYAYHHLFENDTDIQNFAKEIGFNDIYFSTPTTNSVYRVDGEFHIYPVDSPIDFLRFPLLSLWQKLRAAIVLAILKFLPHFSYYETLSAEHFAKRYMGERMWNVFFQQLFRKKFGKYAGKITTSWLWARIHKRTRRLGYIKGGFQAFTDYVEKHLVSKGVIIQKGTEISTIQKKGHAFIINDVLYDRVISTLPTGVFMQVGKKILPNSYILQLKKLSYLDALVLIVETDKPFLKDTYWLNICTPEIPAMVVAQHTNFVSPKRYGNNHLAYIGYYPEREDPLMSMTKEDLLDAVIPAVRTIENSTAKILRTYLFKAPYAQPIFDSRFKQNKPEFMTPVEHLYCANLDMTYPYDRGTNYAVSLGKRVAEIMR